MLMPSMLMPSIVMVQPSHGLEPNMEATAFMCNLLIPEYDLEDPHPYPGDIQPGEYQIKEVVEPGNSRGVGRLQMNRVAGYWVKVMVLALTRGA
jgi:hypothetical protein